MLSVKETKFYKDVLKEINYSFANVFIFKDFIVSEVNEGVNFNWSDHAKPIVDDVSCYLGTNGNDISYISNRINSYSVVAQDWLKYFRSNYNLKGYYIVSPNRKGTFNLIIESLFFNNKIKNCTSLEEAINLIKSSSTKVVEK